MDPDRCFYCGRTARMCACPDGTVSHLRTPAIVILGALAALLVIAGLVSLGGCASGGIRPRPTPPPAPVPESATVHVEVSDTTGAPVPGAEVRLDASGLGTTNATGYVGFGLEPTGPRHVWISAPGYHPFDQHVAIAAPEVIVRVALRSIHVEPEPEPKPDPGTGTRAYTVQLPIRMDGPNGWRDANGPLPVLGASWFPALYFAKHDRARAVETLDMFARLGVDVLRVFGGVGGWESFWSGREIVPVRMRQLRDDRSVARVFEPWPDFDDHFRWLLDECRRRNIGLFITAGDLQMFDDEGAVYERAARVVRDGGYQDVIAMVDVNEGWQNSRAGDDAPEAFAALVRPFADLGLPWATSAHSGFTWDGESGDAIKFMSLRVGAPVATIHGSGGTTMKVRRAFNVRFEGVGSLVGLTQGEPRGPGRDVSAGQVNAPGWVVLGATVAGMTGQQYILHTSRGIRDLAPGEPNGDDPWSAFEPYFTRARMTLDRLPRVTPTAWGHGGRCGTHPEAVFASTRTDCLFHEDAHGVTGQFHRIDVTRYADGRRAVLLYGGITTASRQAKAVRRFVGTIYDTHGRDVGTVDVRAGDVWAAPGAEDGYLLIERVP